MRPEWFDASLAAIPFDEMWADDRHWWPLLLRGDAPLFRGLFAFSNTHELGWWRLEEVRRLPGGGALEMAERAGGSSSGGAAAG